MNRDDSNQVPILDLAPKLKRPLLLWNPLDYLRLFYWVFFFPQALRWYGDKFGSATDRRNYIEWRLILQGLILLAIINFGEVKISELLDIDVSSEIIKNVTRSMGLGLFVSLSRGVAFGVASGVAFGVISGSMTWGVAVSIAISNSSGEEVSGYRGIAFLCMFINLILELFNVGGINISIHIAVSIFCITTFRPESWFLETLNYFLRGQYWERFHFAVMSTPIPSLSKQISGWLEKDWQIGLYNINQILIYTMQFNPTTEAINDVLSKTSPTELFIRVSQLATNPFDWRLVQLASAATSFAEPILDTPVHIVAAGFWYLHKEQLDQAEQAFALVTDLQYGEEMKNLVQTLANCTLSKPSLNLIAAISLPPISHTPHLRPASWTVIASFHRVIKDIQVVRVSTSRSARSFALNRALGELDNILKYPENLDGAEKSSILKIAQVWQGALLPATRVIGEIAIFKPIQNPYTAGDPVQGAAFVGREDTMNQLSELWLMGRSVQSVVLFGHRRMGKTSILRNVHSHIGASVRLVYVNLLLLSNPQGEADVLMFICDEIQRVTGIEPPQNTDFAAFPENTCRRYIQQVCDNLDNQKLIIALDEFEQIENFITAGKISPDFLQFLRGLVQLSPKIAFAFAGLHTLEEMTADYFHPFFASVIPIRVGFLSLGSTRQLLANPDPDFLLDYQPDTLDTIYDLTAGQPYLTQLVGFQLVRHYNNQVFEQGRPRDPIFTTSDLHAVIEDPEFFDRGRYYFTGIWQQAAQDTPHQQTILKAIAPNGLTLSELSTHTNLAPADLQPVLTMLDRHDVICYKNDRYYIAVELFRRWVVDRSPAI
jgi:hypothetical protein